MTITLHISNTHECGYFDDRCATTLFVDPNEKISNLMYQGLLKNGFRRSGELIYRPHCRNCDACIPLRISSQKFTPSRSQQRVLKRNKDVTYRITVPQFSDEHYALYKTYLRSRHKTGGMDKHTKSDYQDSMLRSGVDTAMIEYRIEDKLVCVAITDLLDDGLSAVYTFFDPQISKRRSLGTFAILSQLQLAKSSGRSWLYLGYWIKESRKMAYKSNFSASQILIKGEWKQL